MTNAERAPKGPFAREAEPKALRRLWLSDLATHSHCSSGEQHEAQRESGADCGVAPVALAALATLSFGAVLGPEAPLIALGSVVGTAVLPFVRVDTRESAVLSTAGSFSAVSALFGRPVVAGVLMMEAALGMGVALLPVLLPRDSRTP